MKTRSVEDIEKPLRYGFDKRGAADGFESAVNWLIKAAASWAVTAQTEAANGEWWRQQYWSQHDKSRKTD
ncbi:hypothetical protein LCGC14_0235520 [marine sediment metagenome]|uniref:Uncharacterized protein n=1 Tax=marine sediment metagenome TaxID=412755 RepID=A0A0F9WTR2_9ZZZZ